MAHITYSEDKILKALNEWYSVYGKSPALYKEINNICIRHKCVKAITTYLFAANQCERISGGYYSLNKKPDIDMVRSAMMAATQMKIKNSEKNSVYDAYKKGELKPIDTEICIDYLIERGYFVGKLKDMKYKK